MYYKLSMNSTICFITLLFVKPQYANEVKVYYLPNDDIKEKEWNKKKNKHKGCYKGTVFSIFCNPVEMKKWAKHESLMLSATF